MSRGCGGDPRGPHHSAVLRGLTVLLTLPLASSCAGESTAPGLGASSRPASAVPAATARTVVLDRPVIVDLAVDWRPEREQTPEQVLLQRQRIQRAQEEVLALLGRRGLLRRPLHETAQAALLVDAAGLDLLRTHPRVAAVHPDVAAPGG